MTERWVVWLGTAVAASVMFVAGERWWAVVLVGVGGFVAGRLGPRGLDPLRDFPEDMRRVQYKLAGGRCQNPECGRVMHYSETTCPLGGCGADYNADHVTAWANGGRTEQANCQALCRDCNLAKSDR